MDRPRIDVVAVASSAGGIHALSQILGALPADFQASVVIVQHLDRSHPSLLADILARRTPLNVKQAREGDRLVPGRVLLAPPDHHLLVNPDDTVSLTHTELVHFVRPSADLMFESVAASHRTSALAVILTGSGCDGAMGIRAIKKMGGMVIVQDPKTAQFAGMPDAAILTEQVDLILNLESIAAVICSIVKGDPVHGRRADR